MIDQMFVLSSREPLTFYTHVEHHPLSVSLLFPWMLVMLRRAGQGILTVYVGYLLWKALRAVGILPCCLYA